MLIWKNNGSWWVRSTNPCHDVLINWTVINGWLNDFSHFFFFCVQILRRMIISNLKVLDSQQLLVLDLSLILKLNYYLTKSKEFKSTRVKTQSNSKSKAKSKRLVKPLLLQSASVSQLTVKQLTVDMSLLLQNFSFSVCATKNPN